MNLNQITQLGQLLADEIKSYLEASPVNPKHISFVAHSLGGLVVRSALTVLENLREKFHTFLTLAAPHLGMWYNANWMLDSVMWMMGRVASAQSILEVRMMDNPDPRKCHVYKLSQHKGNYHLKYLNME